jgi:hypothetical protein
LPVAKLESGHLPVAAGREGRKKENRNGGAEERSWGKSMLREDLLASFLRPK